MYRVIALVLNALRIMDGPYFFLKVYEQSAGVIAAWFAKAAGPLIIVAIADMFIRPAVKKISRRLCGFI